MTHPSEYLKAIYGALVAGVGALSTVMVGDVGLGDVTQGQWVTIVGTMLVAGGGVFGITNAPQSTRPKARWEPN